MQHTTKYKFNLIETSDTFSPDALNANAEAVEKELAALEKTAADNKTTLEQSIASTKSALEKADAALQTAVGSGGYNCRFAYGSYVGTGTGGSSSPCSVTVDFEPWLVWVAYDAYNPAILMRPQTNSSVGTVTWGKQSVSWYHSNYSSQYNIKDQTYYYIALGKSL